METDVDFLKVIHELRLINHCPEQITLEPNPPVSNVIMQVQRNQACNFLDNGVLVLSLSLVEAIRIGEFARAVAQKIGYEMTTQEEMANYNARIKYYSYLEMNGSFPKEEKNNDNDTAGGSSSKT